MEILPVLEAQEKPKPGIWYSLVPSGKSPSVSVGHTCTYWPGDDGNGRILIVGGANPGGSFSHTHAINLEYLEWDALPWEGLKARYEHCTLVSKSSPQTLWIFGGAEQSGNYNCIQKITVTESKAQWENVTVTGEPPSPRTYHTNSACVGDSLYVFCGGEAGASPVSDQSLHVFDTASSTWKQPETQGPQPPIRHGHIIVEAGSKIYIHGGMAYDDFLDDMYCLDPSNMTWELVRPEGEVPPGVAAHSAMALGSNIYIFGGLTADGASNAMYKFNIEKKAWTLMKFEGDMPPNRLDHCMCLLPWKIEAVGDGNEAYSATATAANPALEDNPIPGDAQAPEADPVPSSIGTIHLAFVFGGMDTQGVIHNDCVVTVVT